MRDQQKAFYIGGALLLIIFLTVQPWKSGNVGPSAELSKLRYEFSGLQNTTERFARLLDLCNLKPGEDCLNRTNELEKRQFRMKRKIGKLKEEVNNLTRLCLVERSKMFMFEKDPKWLMNLNSHEYHAFSQNGEDGLIEHIFKHIGTTNKYFVEIGAGHGFDANSRRLREIFGWTGILLDAEHQNDDLSLLQEFITPENVNTKLRKYGVPHEPDFFSLNVGYDEYWIWKALKAKPRVILVAYNGRLKATEWKTVEPWHRNQPREEGLYFGASLFALASVGHFKGYCLIGTDTWGLSAFFVRKDILQSLKTHFAFDIPDLLQAYHPEDKIQGLKQAKTRKWIEEDLAFDGTYCMF